MGHRQSQSSPFSMDSRATVRKFLTFPFKCQAYVTRKFFSHYECFQSQLPTHPGSPRVEFMAKLRRKSSAFGIRMYSAPNTSFTSSRKVKKLLQTDGTDIWHISSTSSKHFPYARTRSAIMTCMWVEMPRLFAASVRWTHMDRPLHTIGNALKDDGMHAEPSLEVQVAV